MTVSAIKAGAVDFLTKPVEEDELLRAVRGALDYSATIREERNGALLIATRYSQLTRREREVMEGVVVGKPDKVIASELGICEQTVKVHRGRVMEKMAVDSLADLVHAFDRLNAKRRATRLLPGAGNGTSDLSW